MRSMCTLGGVEEGNTSVRNVESAARNLACCGNTSVLIRTSVHFIVHTATSLSRPKVGSVPNSDLKAVMLKKNVLTQLIIIEKLFLTVTNNEQNLYELLQILNRRKKRW